MNCLRMDMTWLYSLRKCYIFNQINQLTTHNNAVWLVCLPTQPCRDQWVTWIKFHNIKTQLTFQSAECLFRHRKCSTILWQLLLDDCLSGHSYFTYRVRCFLIRLFMADRYQHKDTFNHTCLEPFFFFFFKSDNRHSMWRKYYDIYSFKCVY